MIQGDRLQAILAMIRQSRTIEQLIELDLMCRRDGISDTDKKSVADAVEMRFEQFVVGSTSSSKKGE